MARRSSISDPEELRGRLIELLENFEEHLNKSELREQVRQLIPANHLLRDMGSSLLRDEAPKAARERILCYLNKHVGVVIEGEELMVIGGISEYARRVRELRVQYGWKIITGNTIRDMEAAAAEAGDLGEDSSAMKPDDYMLLTSERDLDAGERWKAANRIRKEKGTTVQDKILKYFRENVGKQITGEELRYVAKNSSEWARRTRELRTECGWPIMTQKNGCPGLPNGVYMLREDKQAEEHDRRIKDSVRRGVLMRDSYTCQDCGWNRKRQEDDARHFEVHHLEHHVRGGANTPDNLITLCNICHDERHRKGGKG